MKKIMVGLLVVLGLMSMSFAHNPTGSSGFGPYLEAKPNYSGVCKAYFMSEEVASMREDLREARAAGDYEEVKEIREEIKEGMPDGCKPRMLRKARFFNSLPEDVQDELREAWKDKDFKTIKKILKKYLPKEFKHRLNHMKNKASNN